VFRPKQSNNPSHLVQSEAKSPRQYRLNLAAQVRRLGENEESPDPAAIRAARLLKEKGALEYPVENLEDLVLAIQEDEKVGESLSLTRAEPPLQKASSQEAEAAQSLSLQEWAENLTLNHHLE